MKLRIQNLSKEAFAPFGQVIEQPDRSPDAAGPGWSWWAGTGRMAGDERPFEIGFLNLQPAELSFDWAERHMRSPELLVPAEADVLVYVAPPDYPETPERPPDLEHFQAFRVRPGQAVLLERGVWHGAPLALDRPARVVVLLLQDSGKIDTSLVRFPDRPVEISL